MEKTSDLERPQFAPVTQDWIDQRVFDLYDEYCHGRIDRREFLARSAALKLGGASKTVPASAQLLAGIREVFDTKHVDRITTEDLLKALNGDELKPWATYSRGNPMSARHLGHRSHRVQRSASRVAGPCG